MPQWCNCLRNKSNWLDQLSCNNGYLRVSMHTAQPATQFKPFSSVVSIQYDARPILGVPDRNQRPVGLPFECPSFSNRIAYSIGPACWTDVALCARSA